MQNRGLLFIPDISGFTRFVNSTEIEHSKLIIQELLEIIINSNKIGLEISEIEGDAVLFYRFGVSPDFKDLYDQVEQMFCEFHKALLDYSCHRYCQCNACVSVSGLTLKVITHYGEFTGYNIRNFKKLIGKDVIVAHQLLKNDIDLHEYWLVTKNVIVDTPSGITEWMEWKNSVKVTEEGDIVFFYTQLGSLKDKVSLDPVPTPELSDKVKVLSFTKEYNTDIITLFHATGDFNYRPKWMEGVKGVKDINHYLPRVGMKCCCVTEGGHQAIYSSSYSFDSAKIEFSETDVKNKSTTFYLLEKAGIRKTRLTINYYTKKNLFEQLSFSLKKKNMLKEKYNKSMQNLEEVIKQIKIPEETLEQFL